MMSGLVSATGELTSALPCKTIGNQNQEGNDDDEPDADVEHCLQDLTGVDMRALDRVLVRSQSLL